MTELRESFTIIPSLAQEKDLERWNQLFPVFKFLETHSFDVNTVLPALQEETKGTNETGIYKLFCDVMYKQFDISLAPPENLENEDREKIVSFEESYGKKFDALTVKMATNEMDYIQLMINTCTKSNLDLFKSPFNHIFHRIEKIQKNPNIEDSTKEKLAQRHASIIKCEKDPDVLLEEDIISDGFQIALEAFELQCCFMPHTQYVNQYIDEPDLNSVEECLNDMRDIFENLGEYIVNHSNRSAFLCDAGAQPVCH